MSGTIIIGEVVQFARELNSLIQQPYLELRIGVHDDESQIPAGNELEWSEEIDARTPNGTSKIR